MSERSSGSELAVFAPPTPGAKELFKDVFADNYANELFDAATQIEGYFIPEYKGAFIDYVVESTGLSPLEADEIFFRMTLRRWHGG